MARARVTEDYYHILGVERDAELNTIINSYRQLALLIHPDRNSNTDATLEFQKLGRAYETLSDHNKRRAYDRTYSILRSPPGPRPSPPSKSISDAEQLATIRISKQQRHAQWQTAFQAHLTSVMQLRRDIEHVQQEIRDLEDTIAMEHWNDKQRNRRSLVLHRHSSPRNRRVPRMIGHEEPY